MVLLNLSKKEKVHLQIQTRCTDESLRFIQDPDQLLNEEYISLRKENQGNICLPTLNPQEIFGLECSCQWG